MHKLQRGAAPLCLRNYRYNRDTWSNGTPTSAEKCEIWQELYAMQGNRCAYCEAAIALGGQHIEHFRQRSRYPQGTFQWDNLFGSCNRQDTCGKHKDGCGPYNHQDLIKPDVEDPDKYFIFVTDGTIKVREGLPANDKHRAEETLRIFSLDHDNGPLRHMRKRASAGYLQTAEEIKNIANEFPPEDWLPLLMAEIAATSQHPFATAIRHALTF